MVNPCDMRYMLGMAKQTKYPVRKLSYFSDEMAKAIDDFRYAQRIPSENEAIRQLIQTGLAARPILLDIQKMLVNLRPIGGDSDLDEHIEAIHKALNPKSA
jgi:hypothetical protein